MKALRGIKEGDVNRTKKGFLYEIIKITSHTDILVKFIGTGTVTSFRGVEIRSGYIKDNNQPSIYGVGFIGYGNYKTSKNKKIKKTWVGMLERCYSSKLHNRHPTYKECFCCDEWHSFQVFVKWFEDNYIEGYQLDKDILFNGNKEYCPSKCMFVSRHDNVVKATAKNYVMKSPSGDEVSFYNLTKFCRDNDLSPGNMISVINGKYKQHKGWTI